MPCRAVLREQKLDYSKDVLTAMQALQAAGAVPQWGSEQSEALVRRNVFMGELRQVGS